MNYPLLESVNSPEELKRLRDDQLPTLAKEIRSFLVEVAERNGGHLASNLGVVELSIALHRVFCSPDDHIIFDVGHQSYVHKMLTGRRLDFDNLRVPGGLGGFTKREESPHDPFGAGHSSTSLSAALGFCEADKLLGKKSYTVAVVGDGAFTGGMIHEALNNCKSDLPLIIILNENGMSISKNKGAFASFLTRARVSSRYKAIKERTKSVLLGIPILGKPLKSAVTYFKKKIKALFLQSNYFEELGLHYIGPYDGNDLDKVIPALTRAKNFGETVVVHLLTQKGRGYKPAEKYPSTYHSVSTAENSETYHSVFAKKLIELSAKDERIVAVTAAMGIGTGLDAFELAFPDRYYDVGIAESHALTFAAGLSAAGLIPYVAVYSTFLQRGYDSVLHDVALQNLPIRIMIDRAGLSFGDGATHHGIFDVSMIMHIPNMRLFAPISFDSLSDVIVQNKDNLSPVAIRYPNGGESLSSLERLKYIALSDDLRILSDFDEKETPEYLFVCYGKIVDNVFSLKDRLIAEGREVSVAVIECLKPFKATVDFLTPYLKRAKKVVFVEEGIKNGGVFSTMLSYLAECGIKINSEIAAVDDNFASPSEPTDLYSYVGLCPEALYNRIKNDE